MKSRKELINELDMDKLYQERDKVLSFIEKNLKHYNGRFGYYRHGYSQCPCTNPVVWEMVKDELKKGGYNIRSRVNSHGVTCYEIHI